MNLFGRSIRNSRQLLIIYYLITVHLAAVYLIADKIADRYDVISATGNEPTLTPTPATDAATPIPEAVVTPANVPDRGAADTLPPGELMIPVQGVKAEQLTDSFADARTGGRIHDAIDIPAPAGTPVVAAADGEIVRFWDSVPGGKTIYQTSMDKKYVYYYAHLADRAPDLRVGDIARRGRTIGYVGDTGNAGAGNFHLHFSITVISDPKKYWKGVAINPYPLLRH